MENLTVCNLCNSSNIWLVDKNTNICRCKDCGYIFDNPRPALNEIIDYYSQKNKHDSCLCEAQERVLLWKRRLAVIKKYKSSGRLLDIGAGIGQFLFFAQSDFKVKGTEVSKSAIEIAKQKYGIILAEGLIENISFDSKFEVITLFHVLEHVLDLNLCCARILSVLKTGGILIIRVPFRENLSQYLEVTYPYKYVHLRNFDEYSLRLLFERIFGCEYVEVAMAGYTPSTNRLRYPMPFQKVNVIACRFVSGIKTIYKPAYELLLKKLYDPIVINVVVRRGK